MKQVIFYCFEYMIFIFVFSFSFAAQASMILTIKFQALLQFRYIAYT